jgi:hypothetical protein
VFLGELQHGVYDDECEDLDEDELNAFYGFEEDGELQGLDESPGQSDDGDNDSDDDSDGNLEELETDEEWMDSEDEVINFPFIKSLT